MDAKECSNLAKEYNGETNWCVLKDMHCPLLVQHERYNFDKEDLTCDYLDSLNPGTKEAVKELSSKKCKGCSKIFKTDNYRVQYCSTLCRDTAKRKSNKISQRKYVSKSGN
ncbi:hypothetical protein [Oceanobacillus sojae]|uniref:hypothetical protein n=1 Tax=Oceanobacillus sojae TaxID=582851 RepID=UPI0021A4CA52|nr:hypothetical protein [Oceanobacillus sojae]MCT1905264.1 hypothetical protein [Oceanobacillus sojae]